MVEAEIVSSGNAETPPVHQQPLQPGLDPDTVLEQCRHKIVMPALGPRFPGGPPLDKNFGQTVEGPAPVKEVEVIVNGHRPLSDTEGQEALQERRPDPSIQPVPCPQEIVPSLPPGTEQERDVTPGLGPRLPGGDLQPPPRPRVRRVRDPSILSTAERQRRYLLSVVNDTSFRVRIRPELSLERVHFFLRLWGRHCLKPGKSHLDVFRPFLIF